MIRMRSRVFPRHNLYLISALLRSLDLTVQLLSLQCLIHILQWIFILYSLKLIFLIRLRGREPQTISKLILSRNRRRRLLKKEKKKSRDLSSAIFPFASVDGGSGDQPPTEALLSVVTVSPADLKLELQKIVKASSPVIAQVELSKKKRQAPVSDLAVTVSGLI